MAFLINHLLEESASKWPDNEALRFDGQGVTYSELDSKSNQLARTILAAGLARGDRVGIFLNKSFASIISLFGILKAGGVYVPIDPNAPETRLAYISRNCDLKILLTTAEKLAGLSASIEETPIQAAILTNPEVSESFELPPNVNLYRWSDVLQNRADSIGKNDVIETDLAYILYTSGSTGQPKGVMISHRTVMTFINWCSDTFHLTPDDRATSHAPLHFDLSTFDIYVTLKAGATVVLVPEKLSVFPIQLTRLLESERITVTYMVPSILSLLVNYGKLGDYHLSALRLILFAGEVFPIKYLRQLVEKIPSAVYYNLYGPTETNVCTYYRVTPDDLRPERAQPVPIGRACENIEVFATAEDGGLVTEPGVEGELWVRGSCVAQGYWGDPEKTARLFVKNPYQTNFEETAYRTGDIVVLDPDRVNWHYVGRRDHMVKSRGYRIELGEIEAALYSYQDVKEAAVVALPDDLLGNRLKAYVVIGSNPEVTSNELLAHCKKILPSYMVPESVEFLDQLPKTSTGKINRPQLVSLS
jgi:amino acid adenylation domain-containing protein